MARGLYCLECNLVLGDVGVGEGDSQGEAVAVCQTCAQHRPAPSCDVRLRPTEIEPEDVPTRPTRCTPSRSLPESVRARPGILGPTRAAAVWQRMQTVLAR
jgi:hypothetical protein